MGRDALPLSVEYSPAPMRTGRRAKGRRASSTQRQGFPSQQPVRCYMSLLTEACDLLGVLSNAECLDEGFLREQTAKARDLVKRITDAQADQDELMVARNEYGSEECEIDDDATTSRSDDGTWVSAWVWVSNEDLDLNDECEFSEFEVLENEDE